MRPSSIDLRERVAAAVDEDEGPQREIARLFRVRVSFVSRLLQRRRQKDTLAPEPHGGGPTPVLSPDELRRLEDLVREHNDDTLDQLKQRGGFNCSLTTICHPAATEIDLQEEDPARRRARPARRPGEAAVVPEEGEAGRAETAGFRGRVGGDHGDDTGLRLGPVRRAGRRLGPQLVGIADRDRRVGSGRGTCPPGVPGVDRHRGVRVVCRAGAGAGAARRRRGRMGQPVPPSGLCRGGGRQAGGCQAPAPAALQPGLHADRETLVEGQGVPRRVAARNKDAVTRPWERRSKR